MKKIAVIALHIGYWMVYALLLMVLLLFIYQSAEPSRYVVAEGHLLRTPFTHMFLIFTVVPSVISFYLFYFILVPKLLRQKKIALFILAAMGAALAGFLVAGACLSLRFGSHFMFNGGVRTYIEETVTMAVIALIHGGLGSVVRGFVSWFEDIRLKQELTRRNYEAELALVKSHINPHFLFNTINNIDVLIEKDAPTASSYLNKLSDILRFMLFETKAELIPLTKKLTYIVKYLDLQKIRGANPGYVQYEINGDPGQMQIAPMLFIPFIENAFKHSENKNAENTIRIRFAIGKDRLTFICANKYAMPAQAATEHGGMGNSLIQRRLKLLYPDRHTLEITRADGLYNVVLTLDTHAH